MMMEDGGKEWCIQRCTGTEAKCNSIINGIMLKFRPIAPKPAVGESISGAYTSENYMNPIIFKKRTKRKYVRVDKKKNTRAKRNSKTPDHDNVDKTVVTLQLLPEKPDGKNMPAVRSLSDQNTINEQNSSTWFKFLEPVKKDDDRTGGFGLVGSDLTATVPPRMRVAESWVTVECVTDTCMEMEGGGLGRTDTERRKNLESDTCPSFISNGYNTVEWVNEAYRKMVMITGQGGEGQQQQQQQQDMEKQILVWLVIKEKLPYFLYPAFTCRVRLQYSSSSNSSSTTCGTEKVSLTMPCDTWRMDSGGFAWKLDVKAALSLGR